VKKNRGAKKKTPNYQKKKDESNIGVNRWWIKEKKDTRLYNDKRDNTS